MKIVRVKKTIEIEVSEFISDSGKVFVLSDEDIVAAAQNGANSNNGYFFNACLAADVNHELIEGTDTNSYFLKNFFIKYRGNPSQNGGNFNFTGFNASEDIYYLKKEDSYINLIETSLKCLRIYREYGYGDNQEGGKHITEDKETSTLFVDWLLNNMTKFDNPEKIYIGLLYYCLRSGDVESINKFSDKINLRIFRRNLIAVIYQTLNKILRSKSYLYQDNEYETKLRTLLSMAFSLISNKRIKCKFVYTEEELNFLKSINVIDDNCFLKTK
jgi:hypothetical protein